MRPAGEIRRATLQTAWELAVERAKAPVPGATWRDAAGRLVAKGMSVKAVKKTWENMAKAGALRPVGQVRVAHAARPMTVYVPTGAMPEASCSPGVELGAVTRGWVAAR